MRDAALLLSARVRPPLPGMPVPLTPARYVQMRRRAAGLTIDQAAERITAQERDRRELRALLRLLETPGTVARYRATIEEIARAFPLDADVYHQLATQPADRHPAICRGCGCSRNDRCHLGDDHLCRMHEGEPAICSRCSAGEWL